MGLLLTPTSYYADVQIIILGAEGEVMAKLYYDPVWNEMKRE